MKPFAAGLGVGIALGAFTTAPTWAIPVGTGAARRAGVVPVSFGRPTTSLRLRYEVRYVPNRFPDLLHYDNGVPAVLSPGENHYGSDVLDEDFDDPGCVGHYLSLPPADWDGICGYRRPRFDTRAGTFDQQPINRRDRNAPRSRAPSGRPTVRSRIGHG